MTFIGVDVAPPGSDRATLTLSGGSLRPRTLRTDATGARVALISTTALLLGGDHVRIELRVGPGAWLELVDTAGTVAYDAAGYASSWTVCITVATQGQLRWKAEPLVVADGANVTRITMVDLADRATAILRETVVLGRTGERGGSLSVRTRVDQAGQALLWEDLDLHDQDTRELPGILGPHRVIDSAMLLGAFAEGGRAGTAESGINGPGARHSTAAQIYQLARPGVLARYLGAALHESPIPGVYATWAGEMAGRQV